MNGDFAELIEHISANIIPADHEYVGDDGLLHCAVCHAATQTRIVVDALNINRLVRCICDCKKREMADDDMRKRREEIERKRRICFDKAEMSSWTFYSDDRKVEKLSDAMKRYAEDFGEYKKEGKGLLLYGPVGTGKSFFAACIANRLIDHGYSVMMTNFASLFNRLQSTFNGKQDIMNELDRYSLLVIDDLGAERSSDTMQEIVYNIIDSRYRIGLPMIVTTNMKIDEIKKPSDIRLARIYDRILQMCHPVEVTGVSRRRIEVKNSYADMNSRLGL